MTTGEKIKAFRKKRRMSQDQLATRCGISQSAISAIELGANSPTIGTLQIIAEGLRVSISELTDDAIKEKPAVDIGGLDEGLIEMLVNLPARDIQRVKDFLSGLQASQKE